MHRTYTSKFHHEGKRKTIKKGDIQGNAIRVHKGYVLDFNGCQISAHFP